MKFYVEIIVRMGTFIVLAKAILQLTGNKNYDKYIHILCDVMLLSMLFVPFMEIFHKDLAKEMNQQVAIYESQLIRVQKLQKENLVESVSDTYEIMQKSYEEEIKSRLNNTINQDFGYCISQVMLYGIEKDGSWNKEEYRIHLKMKKNDTEGKINITPVNISKEEKKKSNDKSLEEAMLCEKCADLLQMSKEYVEVEIVA